MIRRELPAEGGLPQRWVLIGQIDHAHLAGRLAEHWGAGGYAPLEPRDAVLWAVYHHDDGWRDWDQAPGVDPANGRPRAFTEMEIDASLAIWTASIEIARRAGPLEGCLVAGHFCALARRGAAWRRGDPAWPRAEQFLGHYEAEARHWQAAWQAENPAKNTAAVAALALAHLQFFDALSLWFCTAAARGPDQVATPQGPELSLAPRDARHVLLAPWPLTVEPLNLEVPGRMLPAVPYVSRAALAAAASQPIRLEWLLESGDNRRPPGSFPAPAER